MAALAGALLSATPLLAGNIVLTGHDDLHGFFGSAPASTQLAEMVNFARSRSGPFVRRILSEDEDGAWYGCERCDLIDEDLAHVDATSAAIARFFGGIVGLSGDGDVRRRWHRGRDHSEGFSYLRTACGAVELPAVDGDETHHFFAEPDTGGVDPAYCVAERLGDPNTRTYETGAVRWVTFGSGHHRLPPTAVPEPASLTLLGLGLACAIGRVCVVRRTGIKTPV